MNNMAKKIRPNKVIWDKFLPTISEIKKRIMSVRTKMISNRSKKTQMIWKTIILKMVSKKQRASTRLTINLFKSFTMKRAPIY